MAKGGGKHQKETQIQENNNRSRHTSAQGEQAMTRRHHQMPGSLANPFGVIRRFGEGMEQLFDEFGFSGLTPRGFDKFAQWMPQIEMFERNEELIIRADLPGLNKDNVQVEVQDDSIILRGERREESREEREGVYRTERSYGNFYREIPLPGGADTSQATANFSDGVLEISMPVAQSESRRRQLEIKDSKPEPEGRQRGHAAGAGR